MEHYQVDLFGLLLDAELQIVCIPLEKLQRARELIGYFLNKRNKKATLLQFQKLCGFLNFLCRCIVPGRAFLRRLYAATAASGERLKAHHHIRISGENRLDLQMWSRF